MPLRSDGSKTRLALRLRVKVHPGAQVLRIERRDEQWHIWVKAPPVDGKANAAAVEALADFHRVAKSAVRVVAGHSSRSKVFEIVGL